MNRYNLVYILIIVLSVIFIIPSFSQENQSQTPQTSEAISTPKETATQTGEVSIYGEVQSVNQASNSVTVQYYDYDSDEEKAVDVTLDKDTKLDGIVILNDLKQNDWVDVTYSVSGGKNIAKSVKLEKEEEATAEPAPVPETGTQELPEEE